MAEKAILIAAKQAKQTKHNFEESIEELKLLARTAGATVKETITQELRTLNPATYIGKGKAAELKHMVYMLQADVAIFNDQLSPTQERNLNELVETKIVDRTALILDIFASHAHSKEGKIQVELAQYQYLLPRLTGKGIALSRLGGGIGTRGPGETKLESERRRIRKHIQVLKKQLKKVEKQRETQRKKRSRQAKRLSIVGYTNSGKSTLLNKLTKAKVKVADKLFSTLDSTTRRLYLDNKQVTISDTVGFIEKLPTTLIDAFKSTLDEVREADLVLHVVNLASSDYKRQISTVNSILDELDYHGPILLVLNKLDLISKKEVDVIKKEHPDSVVISALEGIGLQRLKTKVTTFLKNNP